MFLQHPHALIASGMVFCEDVGPFQSSKTKAAKAAFFLGADAEARRLGKARALLTAQKLWQLRNIHRNPSRLVFGEQLCSGLSTDNRSNKYDA